MQVNVCVGSNVCLQYLCCEHVCCVYCMVFTRLSLSKAQKYFTAFVHLQSSVKQTLYVLNISY